MLNINMRKQQQFSHRVLFKNYMYVLMGTLIIYMAIFYNFDFLAFPHGIKVRERGANRDIGNGRG